MSPRWDLHGSLKTLELIAWKRARSVLRRGGCSNVASLSDRYEAVPSWVTALAAFFFLHLLLISPAQKINQEFYRIVRYFFLIVLSYNKLV